MAIDFLYPQYEVVRNMDRCIACRACERQCANKVHLYDVDFGHMTSDESQCVNCHRCQLDGQGDFRNLPAGGFGRRAAVLNGQPRAPADLLG